MSFQGKVDCASKNFSRLLFTVKQCRMAILLCLAALVSLSVKGAAQAEATSEEWGERFNTKGAELLLKEIGRDRSANGPTVISYNVFASGLPRDVRYTLWTRLVGSKPQSAANAILNGDGKVVSQLADPGRNIPEDPINLKVSAGRGEPKQFGLISSDGKFRAFAQVIPFPIETSDGRCHLSAMMTGQNYVGILIGVTGLQPGEDLLIDTRSDPEGGQSKGKATDRGTYDSALLPFVKGKRSGKVQFSVAAKSCRVGIELPWGQGSYELQ